MLLSCSHRGRSRGGSRRGAVVRGVARPRRRPASRPSSTSPTASATAPPGGRGTRRTAEAAEADRLVVDRVQSGQHVDQLVGRRPALVLGERGGGIDVVVDHAVEVLHHVEGRADHRLVVARRDLRRDRHVGGLERRLHPVLTAHVVRGGEDVGPRAPDAVGLQSTDVPIAAQVAVCDDESVIGAPFYMMARLDGVVYDDVDATPAHRGTGPRGVVRAHRRARPPARGRLRGGRPRRLRPSRRLPRAPGEALADAVGEVEDGRDAGRRRGRAAPRTTPPHRQPPRDRARRLQLQQHDVPP